jgi:hypothetical protein
LPEGPMHSSPARLDFGLPGDHSNFDCANLFIKICQSIKVRDQFYFQSTVMWGNLYMCIMFWHCRKNCSTLYGYSHSRRCFIQIYCQY